MQASDLQEPFVSVLGVTRSHAKRAVRWLRARSILSIYSASERSLRAPVTKHGRDWTYDILNKAIEATR